MGGYYEQKDSPATQLDMAVVQLIRIQRAVWVTAKTFVFSSRLAGGYRAAA